MAAKKENVVTTENIQADVKSKIDAKPTDKMVEITIPREWGNKKDSEWVCVNDRKFQIKLGVPVKVPDYVAEVIRNRDIQRQALYENEEKNCTE